MTDTTPGYGEEEFAAAFGLEPPRLGRRRMPGDWGALYLVYVLSKLPALQPFHQTFRSHEQLWVACGFDSVPSYSELHLRFGELESRWEGFAEAAGILIRAAKQLEPRIGDVVFVDATAWRSSAQLEHCCTDLEACQAAGGDPPAQLIKASFEEIEEEHLRDVPSDVRFADDSKLVEPLRTRGDVRGRFRHHRIGGHWFRSLDTDSGLRRYRTRKVWFGGYLQAAVDVMTGMPLAVEVFPADVQESDGYPALFDRMVSALGEAPRVVSVDRHYAIRDFFEFNTRRGVGVVTALRKPSSSHERLGWRTDGFDEDGIPRCKYCGGEGDQDGPGLGLFSSPTGEPSIRFRCLVPVTRDCQGLQSIRCSVEWRLLVPLSRKTELFHSVLHIHSNLEHPFRHLRERYGVAGKDWSTSLRRPGIPPQQLQAWASVLLDWLRISLRQGWLEPIGIQVAHNGVDPVRRSAAQDNQSGEILEAGVGTERLGDLLLAREEALTDLPYGAAAKRVRERLDLEVVG